MTKRALVILAEGAEEMEVTITVDVLRRAEIEVVIAGLSGSEPVTCSRGVRIVPDKALHAVKDADSGFDVVILPGGADGTERLVESARVGEILRAQWDGERMIAAICAAPKALVHHSIARGAVFTSHPSVQKEVASHGRYAEEPVVVHGRLITSRGPGTAFPFALRLVERLCSEATAAQVRGPMMLPI